jgi:hypothetical protein
MGKKDMARVSGLGARYQDSKIFLFVKKNILKQGAETGAAPDGGTFSGDGWRIVPRTFEKLRGGRAGELLAIGRATPAR